MENYLVEREVLAQLVDALIAKKYPDQPAADFKELKEHSIKQLDGEIYQAVFGGLTDEQSKEFDTLLDNPDTGDQEIKSFLQKSGINLEQKVTSAMQNFSNDFLGGAK